MIVYKFWIHIYTSRIPIQIFKITDESLEQLLQNLININPTKINISQILLNNV